MNISNTLIIIGNGPSFKDIDLDLIRNKITYGVNGAYNQYAKIKFYPTFWSSFDDQWIRSGERHKDINKMLVDPECKIRAFILLRQKEPWNYVDSYKLTLINQYPFPVPLTWEETMDLAAKEISNVKQVPVDVARSLIFDAVSDYSLSNVTYPELIKYVLGVNSQLHVPPLGLYNYYHGDYPGVISATRVGLFMGYTKFIYLGVDCSYNAKNKCQYFDNSITISTDPIESYNHKVLIDGYNSYHENKIYTWEEYLYKCNSIHEDSFAALQKFNPNVDFCNCSGPKSNLKAIRRGELEKEII